MATNCLWPYMNRELKVKSTECKPSTAIGKNLKSVIPAKQFRLLVPCFEPNQEIQINFGDHFSMKRGKNFLAAIDRFSKYPTACIYEKANEPNFFKFLNTYIENYSSFYSIGLSKIFGWKSSKDLHQKITSK